MSDPFLAGRTALVTGGTSGIGLAIAAALAAAGAQVWINGLGTATEIADALAAVRHPGGVAPQHFGANLADPPAIEAMLAACTAAGGPDVLVNCAGVQRTGAIAELEAATWDRLLAINLSAAFHTMRLALPGMAARGYGRVVNVASVHGLVASVGKAPYVASKFGLVGLTKAAALEYAAHGDRTSGGITINCVCPGWVETPLIEPQITARAGNGTRDDGVRALLREKQPSGRMSLPVEIADAVLWLCRPASHNLTGAAIPIDGGWTAQ
ncbi:MAG: SDR family NAD(P)-dependent oxidoreductase [Arenimonas sp.]